MKKVALIVLLSSILFKCIGQQKLFLREEEKKNIFSFSYNKIWGRAETPYGVLGFPVRLKDTGNTHNNGFTFHYNRILFKGFTLRAGIGYFEQYFNLNRFFDYDSPFSNYPFYTGRYVYKGISLSGGFGYRQKVSNKLITGASLNYTRLLSKKQEYYFSNWLDGPPDKHNKHIDIGYYFDARLSLDYFITKRFSLGVEGLFPMGVTWKHDYIFWKSRPNTEFTKIANQLNSIGMYLKMSFSL